MDLHTSRGEMIETEPIGKDTLVNVKFNIEGWATSNKIYGERFELNVNCRWATHEASRKKDIRSYCGYCKKIVLTY